MQGQECKAENPCAFLGEFLKAGSLVKKLLLVLILIGVGLVGGAFWLNSAGRSNGDGQFTTVPVEWGTLVDTINATGILQPREVTLVGSALTGEVVEIFDGADYNKFVEKGQPLLKLDDRQSKLKQAQANVAVDLAKADVERVRATRDAAESAAKSAQARFVKEVIASPELEHAKMGLAVAEAGLKVAEVKVQEARKALEGADLGLDMTIVRAPTSGVIIDRNVVQGQLVAPPASAQLFTIASDLKWMKLNAQVAEGDSSRVKPGLRATFTVYAYTDADDTFEGTVEEVRLKGNNVQGAVFYSTIIRVANREAGVPQGKTKNWMLKPGMTANVDIQRRRHENVWKVPNAALTFQLDEHYLTPEARVKQEKWQDQKYGPDWVQVWILKNKKPYPIFVRMGGKNQAGESGIKDSQYTEVLEWDPELEPKPDARNPAQYPQVIIGAPPVNKPGIFDKPGLKLS
jgi:HlyD family secretion protein